MSLSEAAKTSPLVFVRFAFSSSGKAERDSATTRTILDEIGRVQSVDVILALADHPNRPLRIRCVVRPDQAKALLLDRLRLRLPGRLRPSPSMPEM
jgi:hypothetical protein